MTRDRCNRESEANALTIVAALPTDATAKRYGSSRLIDLGDPRR
jgi:hypothetical protein